jgi:hypothetical protein
MKRITVFLTEQQIATITDMSRTTGLKFSELLRRIIDQALDMHAQRQKS